MIFAAMNFVTTPGTLPVALGGLALYIASRAAADALAGGSSERPGWRAIGHCLPIAVVALMCLRPSMGRPGIDATGVGRPAVAVGLIFATSVACLTLILGIVTYLAPIVTLPATRKVWPFVMPAALLVLVAGFNGRLTAVHAGMLIVLGLAVFNLWRGVWEEESPVEPVQKSTPGWSRWMQLSLALALAFVGAWTTTRGVSRLEQSSRLLSGALLASTVLAPILTLPVLSTSAKLAERGRPDSAVTTLIAIVLINLCAVLPLLILASYAAGVMTSTAQPTTLLNAFSELGRPLPYPVVSWRVDTVLLVVIGFALIPWSIGRWMFSRAESIALIFAYAVYLGLTAFLSAS